MGLLIFLWLLTTPTAKEGPLVWVAYNHSELSIISETSSHHNQGRLPSSLPPALSDQNLVLHLRGSPLL